MTWIGILLSNDAVLRLGTCGSSLLSVSYHMCSVQQLTSLDERVNIREVFQT